MASKFSFVRRAIEKERDHSMKVEVFVKDDTSDSVFDEEKLSIKERYTSEPCRLSKIRVGASDDGTINYETKLFCSPDLDIPAGSRITVKDVQGNEHKFVRSSDPIDFYASHQEMTIKKEGQP